MRTKKQPWASITAPHPVEAHSQSATGDLEKVRELLNTWIIPNDTREAEDRFSPYASRRKLPRAAAAQLRRLRDDLRRAIEYPGDAPSFLSIWVETLDLRPSLSRGGLSWRHNGSPAGEILGAVFSAIAGGHWNRLKACPDCRWVFFDHSKNGSKKWCLMNAGSPSGRGCGTIAKVRRFRQRQAQ
jgi:predicted RNA-binding Zn ribbon-like protein